MQTALHIMALVSELRREIVGGTIVSTEFYKKERAAYFFFKCERKRLALGFLYHPAGSGCFLAPASKVQIDTREKPWPVFSLSGAIVTSVKQLGLDRMFRINVSKDDDKFALIFEAIGPNGNIWQLDDRDCRERTLRNRKSAMGERYEVATVPVGRLSPLGVTGAILEDFVRRSQVSTSPVTFVERSISGFNRTMALEAVLRAGLDRVKPASLTRVQLNDLAEAVKALADRFANDISGFLYPIKGGIEVYPFKLTVVDNQPEKFKTLSLAVQAMADRRQAKVEEENEQKKIVAVVSRAVKKLHRRLEKLQTDIHQASDYENYRKLGELLQINRSKLKRGAAKISVEDVYSHPPTDIEIALDAAQSPASNIESYFRKYRKGREGLELLLRRREISEEELKQRQSILSDLEQDYERAREQYRAELMAMLPHSGPKHISVPRLPYREHTLSTGLTVYVGREGADNDRTTFEFAKPYELWFHAQQCPGSHVIIKYPSKSFQPSPREIEETAAIAAWHSKARNDSLVPVIFTQRRYVRKPRGAKPGLVTVEREKSVMVSPKKPG